MKVANQLLSIVLLLGLCATAAACGRHQTTQFEDGLMSRTVRLCCNFHHFGEVATDANWYIDSFIPAGTPVTFHEFGEGYVVLSAAGVAPITLYHKYGVDQQPIESFYSNLFVCADPRARIEALPEAVRAAVRSSLVERGMTKEEVLLSVGYPPAHETPSLEAGTWKYWWNRWDTYEVVFSDAGRVVKILPRLTGNEPTEHAPVRE